MANESPSSTYPAWMGFVVGLMGGVAVSSLMIGVVLGYSLGGTGFSGSSGVVAQQPPAVPNPPAAPAAPSKPVAPVSDEDHVLGNPDAKITIIEYSDFECPFCKRHAPTIASIMDKYGDDVNFVYRHFPLSFHPKAQKLAEGSECAAEQGGNTAFFKFHDAVFAKDSVADLGAEQLPPFAKTLGLDEAKFKACLDSGKFAQKVQDQMQSGIDAGVQGTPGNFVVNNETEESRDISGAVPLSTFQTTIDQMLGS